MPDKVCALVGVSRGLGIALAREFGSRGYHLALLGRRARTLESYPDQLSKEGIEARSFAADASRPKSLLAAMRRVFETLGDTTRVMRALTHE